jgi:hypothetical protein
MKLLVAIGFVFAIFEAFLRGFDMGRAVSRCDHKLPLGD